MLLRLEGLALMLAASVAYAWLHASWVLFAALFFVPDVSFAAYWAGPKAGAIAYNTLHSYFAPFVLGVIAWFNPTASLFPFALIWTAHIGFDRALGYGLKYSSAFGHTHLGHTGRPVRS